MVSLSVFKDRVSINKRVKVIFLDSLVSSIKKVQFIMNKVSTEGLAQGGNVWSPSTSFVPFIPIRKPIVGPRLYIIAGVSLALIVFGIIFGAWNLDIIKTTANSISITSNRNEIGRMALIFGVFGGVWTISRWVAISTKRYILAFAIAMIFNFGLNLVPGAIINSNADNAVNNWLHSTAKVDSVTSGDLYKVNGFTLEAKDNSGKTISVKTTVKNDTVTYTKADVKK